MANHENEPQGGQKKSGSQPIHSADSLIGATIAGRYQIVEKIGVGGFGAVYRGKHLTLGTDVAIKVIHPLLSADESRHTRFEREARSLSQIDSQYVVKTIDYVPSPVPCIVMEYFQGKPLDQLISPGHPIAPELCLELFRQLCEGLKAAHKLGFIHRDLKPANILVNVEESGLTSKILDFGIAKTLNEDQADSKLTGTGELIGSPPYMSPEQWCGRKLDGRSDIYSLGCVMYEALTGKQAFSGGGGVDLLHLHLSKDPDNFSKVMPGKSSNMISGLEKVTRKCLAKNVNNRYSSVGAIENDLAVIASGKTLKLKLERTGKALGFGFLPPAPIALAILLVAIGTGATLWFQRQPILTSYCTSLSAAADKLNQSGKADQAASNYRQIISLARLLPDKRDKNKLHAMRGLQQYLKDKGQWQEAKSLQEEELTLTEKGVLARPPRSFAYDNAMNMINSDNNKAQVLIAKALRETPPEERNTVPYSSWLELYAETFVKQNDFRQAREYAEEALKTTQNLLEPDDTMVAMRLYALAEILRRQGYFTDSEKAFDQALAINLKKNTATLANNYNQLGVCQLDQKHYDEAIDSFKQAFGAYTKYVNPKGGDTYFYNMGTTYYRAGNYPESLKAYQRALDIMLAGGKVKKPEIIWYWGHLGQTYKQLNDRANSERCFAEVRKLGGKLKE